MNKKYLSENELIDHLEKDKRIIVNIQYSKFFSERNYISIINPYKELFSCGKDKDGNHVYSNDTDFSIILDLVKLDEDVSIKLFQYISCFEKNFKHILFETICKKYINKNKCNDIYCTKYVDDIRNFIRKYKYFSIFKSNKLLFKFMSKNVPNICEMFFYSMSRKGFAVNYKLLENRKDVLEKIFEIGTGKTIDGKESKQTNRLISHYLNKYGIVPLWAVPNSLSLGELNTVFEMLDLDSRIDITSYFLQVDRKYIDNRKLLLFGAILEKTRKLRNTINHYEPLYPFLLEMTENKKTNESQLFKTIEFLKNNYEVSYFKEYQPNDIQIQSNSSNKKLVEIIEYMKELTK